MHKENKENMRQFAEAELPRDLQEHFNFNLGQTLNLKQTSRNQNFSPNDFEKDIDINQ